MDAILRAMWKIFALPRVFGTYICNSMMADLKKLNVLKTSQPKRSKIKNESQNEPANFTAIQKMSVVRNLKNEGTVVHHKFV